MENPFTIDCEELNKQLLHHKHHLEVELHNGVKKRQKLESEVVQLRKEKKKDSSSGSKKRKTRASKNWVDYSRQHKNRKRKELAEDA